MTEATVKYSKLKQIYIKEMIAYRMPVYRCIIMGNLK